VFRSEGLTDKGLKREKNEDSLLIGDSIFLVSDGMGGHKKGEVASEIVVNAMKRINYSDITIGGSYYEYIKSILNDAIDDAYESIKRYAKRSKIDSIMGATLAGIYINYLIPDKIAVFHLGDSRVYRVRDRVIEPLTTDHSQYEDMKRSGNYSPEQLQRVSRSTITKAIGNFKKSEAEISFFQYKDGDKFLICTDGVSDLCNFGDLERIVNQTDNLKKVCQDIKELVYKRGARDNLSLILLEVELT